MRDYLHLRFEYDETLGFYQWEKNIKQKLLIEIEIPIDAKKAAKSDHLKDTIDYDAVDSIIRGVLSLKHYHLIESIAHAVADTLLQSFPIQEIKVMVDKPLAIRHAKKISVSIHRKKRHTKR
ncbi:MAG: dihydroneopterin aldolase [Deltaproteobacteria bacterium RIFCSPLOWO2_12_FULL_40_28]|nr:MAG: dihydroneopterin aldolase [Deltaproteobacteria bacterium RIFCSPHIGHO2_02_FULL_40_28]OGQ20650.1 MAG: dihydroneopterin aldolase [Deltaproteobacteria bacterium RIFCSPHIGHO2_12_FULL_40_32]OGQ38885.1 MAG: dihydroneopterin aldolase [Deltaproteobacteria bacterium RIFCSPLOWO2_02_FULL_40_36]OGQ55244.1 MAG: dihydroneopterin aldolase [Deltaproteobacteria bacterium RIFCSPLOWO2_12_FULL_40_28]